MQNQIMLSAVENQPKDSIRKRLATFGVSKDVVAKILKSNKFKLYKPQFIQTLKPEDFNKRFGFSVWFQGELEDNYMDNFVKRSNVYF